jgi:hypothetical protein
MSTNTLAYYTTQLITTVKGFLVPVPGLGRGKTKKRVETFNVPFEMDASD